MRLSSSARPTTTKHTQQQRKTQRASGAHTNEKKQATSGAERSEPRNFVKQAHIPLAGWKTLKMAEEHDGDYHIETTDAGASDVIPMEAGQIKKGG
jgi:hypothetical protein